MTCADPRPSCAVPAEAPLVGKVPVVSQRWRYVVVSALMASALAALVTLHAIDLRSLGWLVAVALVLGYCLHLAARIRHEQGATDVDRPAASSQRAPAETCRRVSAVLRAGSVDVALQPIVSLADGRLVGVEALARFPDGRGPGSWFADATACGRVGQLDELTFTAALDLLPQIPASAYLSVNANPGLLLDAGFRRRLLDRGIPLERLVVEITEHSRVGDYDQLNAALDALRAHGVRFAIDDTGAGYASLQHVLQLRPDIIKLDRSLVAGLDTDRARRSLITALVLLALDIGATMVGEGVETSAELDALATLGVDHVQGYLLGEPTLGAGAWQRWWAEPWAELLVKPPHPRPAHHG